MSSEVTHRRPKNITIPPSGDTQKGPPPLESGPKVIPTVEDKNPQTYANPCHEMRKHKLATPFRQGHTNIIGKSKNESKAREQQIETNTIIHQKGNKKYNARKDMQVQLRKQSNHSIQTRTHEKHKARGKKTKQ